MEELLLVLSVAFMFFLRIGIPVLVLIVLGAMIERWQSQRDDYIRHYYQDHANGEQSNDQQPLKQA